MAVANMQRRVYTALTASAADRKLRNGTVVNYPQFKQVVSCKIGAK